MTVERRLQEIALVCKQYGEVEQSQNLDWLVVRHFPLPPGWNSEATDVLILIPVAYPAAPLDNFFVRNGLRTADGRLPGNYSENQPVLNGSWAQFSFHAQEWHPSADVTAGDNLLTFLLAVQRRLQELN